MKKLTAILLALLMLVACVACSSGSGTDNATGKENSSASNNRNDSGEADAAADGADAETEPEPVVIFDPIVYSGSGDDVIEIAPPEDLWVFHIVGNSEERHFSVKGYDANSESTDLFVNTTEAYDGYTFDDTQSSTLLEISATGEWTVEIVSIYTMPVVTKDSDLPGSGDAVVIMEDPEILWMLEASGNSDGRHFSIKGYDSYIQGTELFVNTTDPYEGMTSDPSQTTKILVVSAVGEWCIGIVTGDELPRYAKGDTVTGSGDTAFLVGEVGQTADISGNSAGRHFAVKAYGEDGGDLLVNTTDPYEGTVMLHVTPILIVVTAEGDWTITFN